MNKRDLAQQLVASLGQTLTIADLHLSDTNNSCTLLFDHNLVLNIEFDPQTENLVLSSYLKDIPESGAEPLLRELLGANLYWHRTQGATLCLEESTNGVVLVYAHNVADLDGAKFERVIENFVNQAESWADRITKALGETPPAAGLDGARPGAQGIVYG